MDTRLRLDNQLCFSLYAAQHAMTRAYRPLLRQLNITYPQYLTLVALWEHDTSTVHDLALRLDLPAHAMTPLLQRLEVAGLVVRRRNPRDGRSVLIELTPVGRDLEASAAAVQRTVEHSTGLCPDRLALLREQLHSLTHTLSTPVTAPTR